MMFPCRIAGRVPWRSRCRMKTGRTWRCGRGGHRGGRCGRGRCGRARAVLACAEPGAVNTQVAEVLGVTPGTVGKWRARFAESGLAGLDDSPRPGRPKAALELTAAERAQLERWARRAKSAQALALRARIVLACADGKDNALAAAEPRTRTQVIHQSR